MQQKGEVLRGMTIDPIEKTYWAFSEASLFEVAVKNESRDMWKVYLDKGDHERSLQLTQVSHHRLFAHSTLILLRPYRSEKQHWRHRRMRCSTKAGSCRQPSVTRRVAPDSRK